MRFIEVLHAKNPDDRFPSATDVARILEQCLEHVPRACELSIARVEIQARCRPPRPPGTSQGAGRGRVADCPGRLARLCASKLEAAGEHRCPILARPGQCVPRAGAHDAIIVARKEPAPPDAGGAGQRALRPGTGRKRARDLTKARLVQLLEGFKGYLAMASSEAGADHKTALHGESSSQRELNSDSSSEMEPGAPYIGAALNRENVLGLFFLGNKLAVVGKDGKTVYENLGVGDLVMLLIKKAQEKQPPSGTQGSPEHQPAGSHPGKLLRRT